MMKIRKQLLSLLLCMICFFMLLPVQVFAAGAIDTSRDVSLTIRYVYDKTPISGVQFDLYRVADVDAYAQFTLTGDFKNYPVQVSDMTAEAWKTLAETLSGYVDRDKLTPLDSGKTDVTGTLTFPNQESSLKPGLYLVVGRQLVQDGYTYTTEPFLVSLPNLDTGSDTWTYDVAVTPKFTRTENPPTPDEKTVTRKVLKVWSGDIEQSRPKEVIVQLLKDGEVYDTVTLNAANNWRYTWEKLPGYNEDGSQIIWSVVEKELSDYKVSITQEGITFTVTNTYSPDEPGDDTVTRTVLKVWDDKGYESKRPASVQVTLLQNGTAYDTQTLSDTNGWMYTWDKLPKYDKDGKEISWTIREFSVYGYISTVRQNGYTFVLTNTLDKQKLPQTGMLWWPVPVLACGGLAFLIVGVSGKKKAKSDETR